MPLERHPRCHGSIHFYINNRGRRPDPSSTPVPAMTACHSPARSTGSSRTGAATSRPSTSPVPQRPLSGASTTVARSSASIPTPGPSPAPPAKSQRTKATSSCATRDGWITTVDVPFPNLRGIGDINDRGQLVGTYIDTAGGVRGFRREPDGSSHRSTSPVPAPFRSASTTRARWWASTATKERCITPTAASPATGSTASSGRRSGHQDDLPDSVLTYAFAINNRGRITLGYTTPSAQNAASSIQ